MHGVDLVWKYSEVIQQRYIQERGLTELKDTLLESFHAFPVRLLSANNGTRRFVTVWRYILQSKLVSTLVRGWQMKANSSPEVFGSHSGYSRLILILIPHEGFGREMTLSCSPHLCSGAFDPLLLQIHLKPIVLVPTCKIDPKLVNDVL